MAELTKESCRFVDNALSVMASLGRCIQAFSDPEGLTKAWQEFEEAHCPYRGLREASLKRHSEVRVLSFLFGGFLILAFLFASVAFVWPHFRDPMVTPRSRRRHVSI